MSCHPTDPGNPVSDAARAAGYEPAKEGAAPRECSGALVVQQREVMRFQGKPDGYLKARRGMTRRGLLVVVERAMFGGSIMGGPAMDRPDLDEPDIGAPFLAPWRRP